MGGGWFFAFLRFAAHTLRARTRRMAYHTFPVAPTAHRTTVTLRFFCARTCTTCTHTCYCNAHNTTYTTWHTHLRVTIPHTHLPACTHATFLPATLRFTPTALLPHYHYHLPRVTCTATSLVLPPLFTTTTTTATGLLLPHRAAPLLRTCSSGSAHLPALPCSLPPPAASTYLHHRLCLHHFTHRCTTLPPHHRVHTPPLPCPAPLHTAHLPDFRLRTPLRSATLLHGFSRTPHAPHRSTPFYTPHYPVPHCYHCLTTTRAHHLFTPRTATCRTVTAAHCHTLHYHFAAFIYRIQVTCLSNLTCLTSALMLGSFPHHTPHTPHTPHTHPHTHHTHARSPAPVTATAHCCCRCCHAHAAYARLTFCCAT